MLWTEQESSYQEEEEERKGREGEILWFPAGWESPKGPGSPGVFCTLLESFNSEKALGPL